MWFGALLHVLCLTVSVCLDLAAAPSRPPLHSVVLPPRELSFLLASLLQASPAGMRPRSSSRLLGQISGRRLPSSRFGSTMQRVLTSTETRRRSLCRPRALRTRLNIALSISSNSFSSKDLSRSRSSSRLPPSLPRFSNLLPSLLP